MIVQTIQLALTPVFVLVAIGNILNILSTRLGRVVDRARILQERHGTTQGMEHDMVVELGRAGRQRRSACLGDRAGERDRRRPWRRHYDHHHCRHAEGGQARRYRQRVGADRKSLVPDLKVSQWPGMAVYGRLVITRSVSAIPRRPIYEPSDHRVSRRFLKDVE